RPESRTARKWLECLGSPRLRWTRIDRFLRNLESNWHRSAHGAVEPALPDSKSQAGPFDMESPCRSCRRATSRDPAIERHEEGDRHLARDWGCRKDFQEPRLRPPRDLPQDDVPPPRAGVV